MTTPPPVCAYRIQLTPEQDFAAVAGLVDYLKELGASHLYTSPLAEAEPGSTHGYDAVDPATVRQELGGADALDALLEVMGDQHLAWLLDIVPNHLSIATPDANGWWWDVLRNGASSPYATTFDIDWSVGDGRIIVPVLGAPLDDELADDAFTVEGDVLLYRGGLRLPLADASGAESVRALLERQHYRLVWWKSTERNVRRFFEIDTLAGIRVEDPEVRSRMHVLAARYIERLDGVRVDHIDGLADPDTYLTWLRELIGPQRLLYVEKIVVGSERLPERWPVDGTTGYEFGHLVDQLLVDQDASERFGSLWRDVSDDDRSYHEIERSAIEEVLDGRLAPEVARVAAIVGNDELATRAVVALASHLGRYRTYLPDGANADVAIVEAAADRAQNDRPELAEPLQRLVATLTTPSDDRDRTAITRFQQLTGPAVAKGGEDRALYRYLRLTALNEVGGDPGTFGRAPADFHAWAEHAEKHWPHALLTTSTHDTKRSGDVRARLLALTDEPDAWTAMATVWVERIAAQGVHPVDGYGLIQLIIGAWPIDRDRLAAAMTKSLREAAERSSWIEPDDRYEHAVTGVIDWLLTDQRFLADLHSIVLQVLLNGRRRSLVQGILRLTSPGMGDLYQGDEMWNHSLVDPDNRRPVDWVQRRRALRDVESSDASSAVGDDPDGAGKLALITRTLACRHRHPQSFGGRSAYVPMLTDDPALVAFHRGDVAVITQRAFNISVDPDTRFEQPGTWYQVLVDGAPPVVDGASISDLLGPMPVALLERR